MTGSEKAKLREAGADEALIRLVDMWDLLSEDQKRKIRWIVHRERIKWWVKRLVPAAFVVSLIQFVVWSLAR